MIGYTLASNGAVVSDVHPQLYLINCLGQRKEKGHVGPFYQSELVFVSGNINDRVALVHTSLLDGKIHGEPEQRRCVYDHSYLGLYLPDIAEFSKGVPKISGSYGHGLIKNANPSPGDLLMITTVKPDRVPRKNKLHSYETFPLIYKGVDSPLVVFTAQPFMDGELDGDPEQRDASYIVGVDKITEFKPAEVQSRLRRLLEIQRGMFTHRERIEAEKFSKFS